MSEIRFFCPGIPSPGGSKSVFPIKAKSKFFTCPKCSIEWNTGPAFTGRFVVTDAGGKKTKEWRQDVAKAALLAMKAAELAPLSGAIEVEMIFQMPRPKSHYRSDGVTLRPGSPLRHMTRPDVLKLARSTEDSLTGICFADDAQIVKETIEKAYSADSGCWVIIREAGK
jgi:Holliday junction resolvase RusA-like endonuclease